MIAFDHSPERISVSAEPRPTSTSSRAVARRDLRFVSLERRGGRSMQPPPRGGRVSPGWIRAFLREGL